MMLAKKDSPLTYKQAGVDIGAGNALVRKIIPIAETTQRSGVMGHIGGFGALFDLAETGFRDPVLVAATDGVGTKLKIAIQTNKHNTIGIDLVAMCVNDLLVQGAEPLFFLDYFACGKLDTTVAESVIAGISEGCRQAGAALIGGETAEMPGMYGPLDYDLAGFAVGAVERQAILPRDNLKAGDALVALASSGAHSNGFSLIRRIVERSGLLWHDRAPFDETRTLGEALLEPTRIYVKPCLDAIRETGYIKALAHITGSGPIENIPRILPKGLTARINRDTWQLPELFQWLAKEGRLDEGELLRTFNCGIGMVVVCDLEYTDTLIQRFNSLGEQAWVLGELIASEDEDQLVRFEGKPLVP